MIATLFGWASWLLGAIGRVLRAVFDWATEDWRHAAIAMLAGVLAVTWLVSIPARERTIAERTEERDVARGERDAEIAAHRKTKTNYRTAQAEAARRERARIERVRAEQQEITHAVLADYRLQLAGVSARAERLREELRARNAAGGAGAGYAMPGLSDAAGRAAAAPPDPRLPAAASAGPFGRSEAEQLEHDVVATRQALQLDALIRWVTGQAAIDSNAGASPDPEAE